MGKNRKDKAAILIVLIFILLIIIVVIQNPSSKEEMILSLQNNENTGLDIGNLAPDFILKSVGGSDVQLSSFRGKKAVVVNFWATWCPPCREEMPAFEEIYKNKKGKMEILGVNLQESERAVNNFLKAVPVTYPLLLDPDASIKKKYNVFTQPITYFINKEGIIIDKKFGPLTEGEIEDKFNKLGIQ